MKQCPRKSAISRRHITTLAIQGRVQPGVEDLGCVCIEMLGSHRMFMVVEQKLRDWTKLFTNLYRSIEQPVVTLLHPYDFAVLVKSKNIVSLSMSPGIMGYPQGTWLIADLMRQSS